MRRMVASGGVVRGGAEPTIEIRGLTRRFGRVVAIEPLDLDLHPGVTGLLGPNGSGKSTLLRMLTGLVRPSGGGARVGGVTLAGDGAAVRRRCAYSPGEIALYGELRARDHLAWFLRGREPEALARARELAATLGLPLDKRVHAYSHGMKRQLMFAAALAPRVPVRILDEPSDGLDPQKRGALLDLLKQDAGRDRTILLSSHHFGEVDRVCERFVFLNAGRLVTVADAAAVRERAERLVQVDYGAALDDAARAALEAAVATLTDVRVRLEPARLVAELPARDPRALLAALSGPALPAPRTIRYGEVSLAELYRDLYGVEAC